MKKNTPVTPFVDAVHRSKYYWVLIGIIWIICLIILLLYGPYQSFMWVNDHHTSFLDFFLAVYTNIGDGIFAIAIGILFLFFKHRRIAFLIFFSFLLSGLFAQILKRMASFPRPSQYFINIVGRPIHTLDVTNWGNNTFPSGHTATAFALLTSIILYFPKSKWNIMWIILAFMVGYSRVYIASHFLEDVLAGAGIGVFTAMICYIISNNIFYKKPNWFLR